MSGHERAFGWGVEDGKRSAQGLGGLHWPDVQYASRRSIYRAYFRGYVRGERKASTSEGGAPESPRAQTASPLHAACGTGAAALNNIRLASG